MRLWEVKASFLAIVNLPKCVVAVLLMKEGLFSLLFYCESGTNQYAGQKIITDNVGASLLLLEFNSFKNIVLSCNLKMISHVFVGS